MCRLELQATTPLSLGSAEVLNLPCTEWPLQPCLLVVPFFVSQVVVPDAWAKRPECLQPLLGLPKHPRPSLRSVMTSQIKPRP